MSTEKKYTIIDQQHGEIKSQHKTLELANKKLESIDSVYSSFHATDVDWLKNDEEALAGYRYCVIATSEVEKYAQEQKAFFAN